MNTLVARIVLAAVGSLAIAMTCQAQEPVKVFVEEVRLR